jgi:hypothetical protein
VTTPHGSRGGSVPPRPSAGKPQQWFTLRPWVFDVTLAGVLLRAAPRPPVPIPVAAWARAYGLARDPGSGRHAISLIGPGPDFSPQYALTTNPGEPVILATLADASGELTPLLIDGYALPVIVQVDVMLVNATFAIPAVTMPCADSSTICARRQVSADPVPRRVIRSSCWPLPSPILRTRSRSVTGPVSMISTPGKAFGRTSRDRSRR